MKLPSWVAKAIGLYKEAGATPGPIPPVPFCFIDGKRNSWITKGETFGCGTHVYHVPTGTVHAPADPPASSYRGSGEI